MCDVTGGVLGVANHRHAWWDRRSPLTMHKSCVLISQILLFCSVLKPSNTGAVAGERLNAISESMDCIEYIQRAKHNIASH